MLFECGQKIGEIGRTAGGDEDAHGLGGAVVEIAERPVRCDDDESGGPAETRVQGIV